MGGAVISAWDVWLLRAHSQLPALQGVYATLILMHALPLADLLT